MQVRRPCTGGRRGLLRGSPLNPLTPAYPSARRGGLRGPSSGRRRRPPASAASSLQRSWRRRPSRRENELLPCAALPRSASREPCGGRPRAQGSEEAEARAAAARAGAIAGECRGEVERFQSQLARAATHPLSPNPHVSRTEITYVSKPLEEETPLTRIRPHSSWDPPPGCAPGGCPAVPRGRRRAEALADAVGGAGGAPPGYPHSSRVRGSAAASDSGAFAAPPRPGVPPARRGGLPRADAAGPRGRGAGGGGGGGGGAAAARVGGGGGVLSAASPAARRGGGGGEGGARRAGGEGHTTLVQRQEGRGGAAARQVGGGEPAGGGGGGACLRRPRDTTQRAAFRGAPLCLPAWVDREK